MATIDNLREIEQGSVAAHLYNEDRDDMAAALALGEITRYTSGDPMKMAATAFLDADLQRFAQTGSRAVLRNSVDIFSGIYDKSFNELTLEEFSEYYNSAMDVLSDETKQLGKDYLNGNPGKTLNEINKEYYEAERVLKTFDSTEDEIKQATEVAQKFAKFENFRENLSAVYVRNLAEPSKKKAERMKLEQSVRNLAN